MKLLPGGPKSKTWGVVGGAVVSAASFMAVVLAFGVPGPQGGCGGLPDAPANGVMSAELNSPNAVPCVEQLGLHEGTCVETNGNGDRSCRVGPPTKPLQCPKGCTAGVATFSWSDVLGDEVKGSSTLDLNAMCQMRKPPGLDCAYVEHLPCLTSK